jgi:hypothetical protein
VKNLGDFKFSNVAADFIGREAEWYCVTLRREEAAVLADALATAGLENLAALFEKAGAALARWERLENDRWGIRIINGAPRCNEVVRVTRRDGEQRLRVLGEQIRPGLFRDGGEAAQRMSPDARRRQLAGLTESRRRRRE